MYKWKDGSVGYIRSSGGLALNIAMFLYVLQRSSKGHSKTQKDVEQAADKGAKRRGDNIDIFIVMPEMSGSLHKLHPPSWRQIDPASFDWQLAGGAGQADKQKWVDRLVDNREGVNGKNNGVEDVIEITWLDSV